MDLTAERDRVLTHSRTILDGAKAAGRTDLTDTEQGQLEADLARVTELDKQIKGRRLVKQVTSLWTGDGLDDGHPRSSVFTEEDRHAITHAVRTRTAYRTEVSTKALLTIGALLLTSGTMVQAGLHPSAYPLAGLFQQVPADGPVQRYYRAGAGTAAVVAEGR